MMDLERTISCPICGAEKQFLNIHLRRIHGILPEDAKRMFNLEHLTSPALLASKSGEGNSFHGKHHSDQSKDKMIQTRDGKPYRKEKAKCSICGKPLVVQSATYCREHCGEATKGVRNPAKRQDVREKISKSLAEVKEQRSKSISLAKTGVPRPDMLGEKNFAKREEVREKIKANNGMKRKEVVRAQIASGKASPNYPESVLFAMIQELFPNEYALNPKGEVIKIGNKRPDIVNINGQKKLIEHFGRRWHEDYDEQERKDFFKAFGFDCLVVWNEELKDKETLTQKLVSFHKQKRFNDCNQSISIEMVVQSDPCSDTGRLAEQETTNPSFRGIINEKK